MDRGFQKPRICQRLSSYEEDQTVFLLLPFFQQRFNTDGPYLGTTEREFGIQEVATTPIISIGPR